MSRYTDMLGSVSPTARGAKRAADIVAALAPPTKSLVDAQPKNALDKSGQKESLGSAAVGMVPGVLGGATGAFIWGKHRVLGFLLGHAVGAGAMGIYKGGAERKSALTRLGVEGAGVGGSLLWKRHPVLGWLLGMIGGTIVAAFVPESGVKDEWNKLKAGMKK